jgi:hypothetical protein
MDFSYVSHPTLPPELKALILETVEKEWDNLQSTNIQMYAPPAVIAAINEDVDLTNNLGWHYSESKAHFPFICDYYQFDVPAEVALWLRDNVSSQPANIQVMTSGSHVPPHIDEVRKGALNYVIETGGDVRTVFYNVKNENANENATPFTVIPYEKLDVSNDVEIQAERWHSLDTTRIHSVEGISSVKKRIAITISIIE